MKVLFSTNVPSPYRVNFFNELGKQCELTVLFEKEHSTERDKSWKEYSFDNFQGIFLKGISLNTDTALCLKAKKYIKKIKPDFIIICNFASPTGILLANYCIKHDIRYYIESDGGFENTNPSGIKYQIKKMIFENAYKCFSTSSCHDKYYLSQGANINQIIRYHFTSLYQKDIVSINEKKIDSKQINLLFVGQFIERKGLDILLKSLVKINKENFKIKIVGGSATDEYIEFINTFNLVDKVSFVEFKSSQEIHELMVESNIFILPTREDIWGLVINEAMACGNAIITTDKCVAGLELIKNGQNGYLIHSEDFEELSLRIKELIYNPNLILKMGKANIEKMQKYTFEQMALDHMETFRKEG